MSKEKTPGINLDKIIGMADIVRGVGELIVDEAKLFFGSIVNLYDQPPLTHYEDVDWTPVQRDAAQWMDKVDLEV